MKKTKKEKQNKVVIAGETKSLICPDQACRGILYFDRSAGYHRCIRCKRYWQYTGEKVIMKTPRKLPKGKKSSV
ncbi:hypothetical protein J7K24_02435 [bacterium]|nr:hypothetical protein [bacterium]